MTKYQDRIKEAMQWLGNQPKTVFMGEGLKNAGEVYGTLSTVPLRKCLEVPICENLLVGAGIGLTMQGFKVVIVFQRMDFMLLAADAIINHLALIPSMSGGQFPLSLIIRAIIGSTNPKFDMGPQHNKDLRYIFEPYIKVITLEKGARILSEYKKAYASTKPTMIVERRDLYEPD